MESLFEIRSQLHDMAEQEATKLYRLARRSKIHGCDQSIVDAIQKEANELHMMQRTELLTDLDFTDTYKYAFKG